MGLHDFIELISNNLLTLILYILICHGQTIKERKICEIRSISRKIGVTKSSLKRKVDKIIHGRCEIDNHVDTCVTGSNWTILQYIGKVCDVSPYRDDYKSIKNVPIVNAAPAW